MTTSVGRVRIDGISERITSPRPPQRSDVSGSSPSLLPFAANPMNAGMLGGAPLIPRRMISGGWLGLAGAGRPHVRQPEHPLSVTIAEAPEVGGGTWQHQE
jgi:hypothetical protein